MTLANVIEEQLAQGKRILLASTTNAAIDQVLAKTAARAWFSPGGHARLGRSEAETFGTEIGELVAGAARRVSRALELLRAWARWRWMRG